MSSTNRKRAARALAARTGMTYQQALASLGSPTAGTCPRCGGTWGEDLTCPRCTTEDGAPRPTADPGPLGPGADEPEIVWADDNGRFRLSDGSHGNPGCDGCGQEDAVARIDGRYACVADVAERGIEIPDAFHCFGCGRDLPYQFSDECRDCRGALSCHECGLEMVVEAGTEVSHHLDADGEIDYDADADHVAYHDPALAPAGRCSMCNGDISYYAPGQTMCVWCSGDSED